MIRYYIYFTQDNALATQLQAKVVKDRVKSRGYTNIHASNARSEALLYKEALLVEGIDVLHSELH